VRLPGSAERAITSRRVTSRSRVRGPRRPRAARRGRRRPREDPPPRRRRARTRGRTRPRRPRSSRVTRSTLAGERFSSSPSSRRSPAPAGRAGGDSRTGCSSRSAPPSPRRRARRRDRSPSPVRGQFEFLGRRPPAEERREPQVVEVAMPVDVAGLGVPATSSRSARVASSTGSGLTAAPPGGTPRSSAVLPATPIPRRRSGRETRALAGSPDAHGVRAVRGVLGDGLGPHAVVSDHGEIVAGNPVSSVARPAVSSSTILRVHRVDVEPVGARVGDRVRDGDEVDAGDLARTFTLVVAPVSATAATYSASRSMSRRSDSPQPTARSSDCRQCVHLADRVALGADRRRLANGLDGRASDVDAGTDGGLRELVEFAIDPRERVRGEELERSRATRSRAAARLAGSTAILRESRRRRGGRRSPSRRRPRR